jgi:transposase
LLLCLPAPPGYAIIRGHTVAQTNASSRRRGEEGRAKHLVAFPTEDGAAVVEVAFVNRAHTGPRSEAAARGIVL